MALSRKQFDMLEALMSGNATQRKLQDETGMSLGSVNRTIKELTDLKYVDANGITEYGKAALEPYRVKRAVFIAAGFGSRLVPITRDCYIRKAYL